MNFGDRADVAGLGEYQHWLGVLEIMPAWLGLASTSIGWVFWRSCWRDWAWRVPALARFLEIMPVLLGLASCHQENNWQMDKVNEMVDGEYKMLVCP